MAELFLVPNPTDAAASSDRLPPDWEVRNRALDTRQSWIVEAPAGSGKTGLLIQRFLKLLADESVTLPEQVLAITFTIKATGEMRDRISAQLRRATEPDSSQNSFDRETRTLALAVLRRDEQLGWGLLEDPRRLNVRTIDSVCGEIAHSLPVLSGGGARLSPVEDATPLYREAARQTLMQLGGADEALTDSLRTLLLHRAGSLADCELLLAEMLETRVQWGELIPLTNRDLDDSHLEGTVRPMLQRALDVAICAALTQFDAIFPADTLNNLAALAGEMGYAAGYKGKASPIAQCAGIFDVPHPSANHLLRWRALMHLLITKGGEWRKGAAPNHLGFEIERHQKGALMQIVNQLRDRDDLLRLIELVSHLPPAEYPDEQWLVAKALFRVLRHSLAELQIVFADRGECDFSELGLLAATAMQREGAQHDLAASLGVKFQHLLVDEMQDTSISQYRLIEALTQGWDGQSQTVFLVGDPKQSIYLFRQARVERFVETLLHGRLGELSVGTLRLTANFRSQAGLVRAYNDDFCQLFPREANPVRPEDVPYVKAEPARPDTAGVRSVVWHGNIVHADASGPRSRHQARLDAQAIRKIVEQWRASPLPQGRTEPWKIAVLARSRNILTDVIAELTASAIPFRAVDIVALGQTQEVLDLFALTRALLHPADRVAWLGVLRAPWCGLELAELHVLAGADDASFAKRSIENVLAERGHLLSEESCTRLTRLWPVMRAAAARLPRLSLSECVERTWRSLGGDAYLQPAQMANARRYFQLLDELDARASAVDLGDLRRRMDSLFAETIASEDAVDLMTIHGAKGLEWDVVIVTGLEKQPRADKRPLLMWEEIGPGDSEAAHVVLAPVAGKGEGSQALNDWLSSIHKAREVAEQKRVFYVACTRAKEELHLFAAPKTTATGQISLPEGSLLKIAWPVARRHFDASAVAPEFSSPATGVSSFDEGTVALDLAAASEPASPGNVLRRLPLSFDPQARFAAARTMSYGDAGTELPEPHFKRPEGSFEARVFGNTVHALLEMLAKQIAGGAPIDALIERASAWEPRIKALLRTGGLSPEILERRAPQVMKALVNTLHDEEGRWILAAQEASSSELAMTTWQEKHASVRFDRCFRAGREPLAPGLECVWIVDYKTAAHSPAGVESFLKDERAKYTEQMETYARMIRTSQPSAEIRVGLYYPMLPKLIWWRPTA